MSFSSQTFKDFLSLLLLKPVISSKLLKVRKEFSDNKIRTEASSLVHSMGRVIFSNSISKETYPIELVQLSFLSNLIAEYVDSNFTWLSRSDSFGKKNTSSFEQ